MNDQDTEEFELAYSDDDSISSSVTALEPLYSMLLESSHAALMYLLKDLRDFKHESELDDVIPSTGLSRREMLEQVNLALRAKRYIKQNAP